MLNPDDFRFPSIEALQAFEAAARLGTFERAAELLSITGSAASKRVSGLEGMLGVSLLQRDGRSLALTSHGREYLEQIAPILAQLAAVPLHRRQVQRQQRLTLRTPPTFARQILIPRLASFAEACPEIELEILLSSPSDGQDLPLADVEVRGDSHGVAAGERQVATVIVPNDVQQMAAPKRQPHEHGHVMSAVGFVQPRPYARDADLEAAAAILNRGRRVAILAG
ncbi:LysR family transcriptional regulator, partial [Pseudomonas aeruginosa]|nr:LysR family transcriptional regulator [Pseudomonas aeruginosa]